MPDVPDSFSEYQMLQVLSGYTREDLLAEDADFVRDVQVYMRAEAEEAKKPPPKD